MQQNKSGCFFLNTVYMKSKSTLHWLLGMLTSLEIYMAAGSKISVKFNSALMIKIVLHNFLSVTPFGNAMFQKRERWQL